MEVRLAKTEDAERIAEIYEPHVSNAATSFEHVAPTEKEMKKRITDVTKKYPWYVAEEGGDLLGYCYAC